MTDLNDNLENEQYLVSIIVATYRRDKSLEKALLSIANQTYKSIEIIIVDDNADKEWEKKVNSILDSIKIGFHKKIIYVANKENKGSAETRNIGIKKASGTYITFLDDDDLYLPDKVRNQVKHMIKKKSDFSITDLCLYDEHENMIEIRRRNYIKEFSNRELFRYHLKYHMTGTDTMMFKRDFLNGIGGFPPIDVGDEFYLMQKAIESGGVFSYLPVCDIKAYVHTSTNGLSSGISKINGENQLFVHKKGYFHQLERKDIRYIKMRHYAVLAFAEIRRRNIRKFIENGVLSFLSSPLQCIKLFINRK